MEILFLAVPVIPVGALIGYLLARLVRPVAALWSAVALFVIAAGLILAGLAASGSAALEYPILAITLALPLAVGCGLGGLIDWLLRCISAKD